MGSSVIVPVALFVTRCAGLKTLKCLLVTHHTTMMRTEGDGIFKQTTTDQTGVETTDEEDKSPLLGHLVQTRFTLSTREHDDNALPNELSLWALPEPDFLQLTSSQNTQDGTGMRPYSGALAFLQFVRAFPRVFSDASLVELGAGIGACGLLG